MTPSPRVALKTIGCRLNQAETARIAAQFAAAGYAIVPFGEACQLCIIHGCAVTATAERDCVRAVQQAARLPGYPQVVLAGCPVATDTALLQARFPTCLLAGQKEKFRLPALLHATDPDRFPSPDAGRPPQAHAGPSTDSPSILLPRFETTRAAIKIQDGCDFGCAYCVVPRTRGRPWSRPHGEILEEIRRLADAGYREIVLTGANLGCYRDSDWTLPRLVRQVANIPGVDRIRLSSIELSTAEREILDLMAESSTLCHFLHVPLQSGSDRILNAMGRRYTRQQYRAMAEYAVARIPRLGLGADIIAGFPGEDDAAFRETEELVQDLPFSNLHVFPYSPRPGTRAAALSGRIPMAEKKARVRRLLALAKGKREAFARRFVGSPVAVLIERVNAAGEGRGWTAEYLEARITGPDLHPNQIVSLAPESTEGPVLRGHLP